MIRLSTAVTRYPATQAVLDGEVSSPETELEFVDFGPSIVAAFRKVLREHAYDLAEIGVTTFIPGLDFDVPYVGVPVFPARNFNLTSVVVHKDSGINEPADLKGKKVACRTYGVTAVVWIRSMLQELYGVDPASITWVVNDMEHLAEYKLPDHVDYREGADLGALIESGEVDAGMAIYRGSAPQVVPLFTDAKAIEKAYYEKTGILPIHHMMVVRRELAEANPGLPQAITDLFTASKDRFLAKLASGAELDAAETNVANYRELVGPDPVPQGIEANRVALDALLRLSKEQQLLKADLAVEDLFAPGVA